MSGPELVLLTDAQLERLAVLVADRLQRPPQGSQRAAAAASDGHPEFVSAVPRPERLLSAAELAGQLGVDVKSIYRHAEQLGGVRVGRAWRFSLERARAASAEALDGDRARSSSERPQPSQEPASAGRKRRRGTPAAVARCQLLPVGRVDGPANDDERTRR